MNKTLRHGLLAGLLALPLPGLALDVLVTNDDGFETANIQALFSALQAEGHRVIMAAPYVNQSGTSGSIEFLTPLFQTQEPSEEGALPAGSEPIGETTLAPGQYYVNTTPVGAVLYGLELAQASWGKAPDVVLSGPNDGNNLGTTTIHSGTVGATVTALSMGVPAIALSAANDEAPELVAELAVQLLDSVVKKGEINLPDGTGLNVNFPAMDPVAGDTAADFRFELTQIGSSSNLRPKFYERLAFSPLANLFFAQVPEPNRSFLLSRPGVSIEAQNESVADLLGIPPQFVTVVPIGPEDNDPSSESNAILAGDVITVSVIEATYQASPGQVGQVRGRLNKLFK